ncbi:amino acid ABC transporter substrate-binding protein [Amycolatopsis sp. K13G38]|uniref:Amino acid ABC transporter substrate-binding protein n=1 Tax=Amycolatopsis acididurans TaxID=2724524 RepID=A0ABX1J8Q5_9PSEU|nr:ABC transporter substrate-binding protein [Amycolatopsis acididurans]NKQ56162.1 amino acid ABC transporter substrate-binding protein [Amycolatopsis acididurans]
MSVLSKARGAKRVALPVAAATVAITMVAACSSGGSAGGSTGSTQKIEIGTISDLSGPASVIGLAGQEGQKIAESLINKDPKTYLGSADRSLTLSYSDASNAPAQAVTVARQYIQDGKVSGIIGPLYTAQAQALAPITTQAKIPLLVPYTPGSQALTNLGDFVFASSQPDQRTVQTAITAMTKQFPNDKTIGIVYGSDSAAHIPLAAFAKQAITAAGLTPVEFSLPFASLDYNSAISTLQSKGVQAIYICSNSPAIAAAMQQAERSNYHPHWVGYSTMFDQSVITAGGPQAAGAILTSDYDPTLQKPLADTFRQQYQATYHKAPNSWAALGFQSVMTTAAAIAAIPGKVTGQALRDAMQNVKATAVVGDGTFTFDQQRLTSEPPAVLTIRDNTFQRVSGS